MAAAAPARHAPDAGIMRDGDWILVRLPSDNIKLLQLRGNSKVAMGKFGSFLSADAVGLPFGLPYEAHKGTLREAPTISHADSFDIDIDESINNQDIMPDDTSQGLSYEEIERLKAESIKGNVDSASLIKAIVENSKTYEKKTGFAKRKYLLRKEKKYSRVFTPLRPTSWSLCEFFFRHNPAKTKGMRIDTLSQMMTLVNARAGQRYIVVDDCGGIVAAALLERMNAQGNLVAIVEQENNFLDVVKYLNLGDKVAQCLYEVPWFRLHTIEQMRAGNNTTTNPRQETKALADLQQMELRSFDGLIVAGVSYPIEEVVDKLRPYLRGSSPVVVYSQFRETLVPGFVHFRKSQEFIYATITEPFLREYQVSVNAFGTHPLMTGPSTGGYILSAIRVWAESASHSDNSEVKTDGEISMDVSDETLGGITENGPDSKRTKINHDNK